MSRVLPWVAVVCLLWAGHGLEAKVDRRLGEFRAQEEVLYVSSGEQLKWLAPGFEALLADVYWLRTVQYFGRAILRGHGGAEARALIPLVEITIALDPKFAEAYMSGATFIGEPPPIGPGNPQAAVRILERGAVELPEDWIVQQHLGYGTFILLHDNQRAADRLMRASRIPGAPFWLKTLAAGLLADGGERDKSRLIWAKIYEQSDPGPMRQLAQRNLMRLDALAIVDRLNQRVAAFEQAHGRRPQAGPELQGLQSGLPPADPSGTPFAFDSKRGEFGIGEKSLLWSAVSVFERDVRERKAKAGAASPSPGAGGDAGRPRPPGPS